MIDIWLVIDDTRLVSVHYTMILWVKSDSWPASTISSTRPILGLPFRVCNVLGYSFSVQAISHIRVSGKITLILENWAAYPSINILTSINKY